MLNNFCFEIILKILYSRAGHIWQYDACALHIEYIRLYTHTLRICSIYFLSIAAIFLRTRLNITLHTHCVCCHMYYVSRLMPKHFPLYFVLIHPQSTLIRLVKTIHILGFVILIFLDFQAGYCLLFTNHGNGWPDEIRL